MPHLSLKIFGQVQGVFFRASAKQEADALGLRGFVRNEPDGTVYAQVEGDSAALDAFVRWCHSGSSDAVVERVDVEESEARHFTDFRVV